MAKKLHNSLCCIAYSPGILRGSGKTSPIDHYLFGAFTFRGPDNGEYERTFMAFRRHLGENEKA